MTHLTCFRCKKEIPDGTVQRLYLKSSVSFDPVCWSAYVDEVVAEMLAKAEAARAAVGTVKR